MNPDRYTALSGPPPGPVRHLIRCQATDFERRCKSDAQPTTRATRDTQPTPSREVG
ncbi:hypothetical protein BT67DRAFT_443299 [Trichocladium antarcticum]|uniref:Uncharacterized protein n=1 Tax=Trichocladium antarcticum TaxID=1450529 RepID=A0AAN6UHI9_9PEZI|nr:hypothetical protein BT67DRAFT_443299 [Trichocladium antarcticum]